MTWPDDYISAVGIEPYHVEPAGVIWCADCRDILPHLPKVDLVLTDPPYGNNTDYLSYDDSFENWKELIINNFYLYLSGGKSLALTAGLLESEKELIKLNPLWRICWYKDATSNRSPIGFRHYELIYIYGEKPPYQIPDYFKSRPPQIRSEVKGHPCPKPLGFGKWLINKLSLPKNIILDPFLGSGTTAVAAKELGRKFIGIEISEEYCRIAVKRLRQGVLNF